jgi:hypothetical protein
MATRYLTSEDAQNYGHDLLDVSQRAALDAVSPLLDQLAQDNNNLRQQVAREARHRLDRDVETLVPNFREIDRNPRWHRWLLGVDSLSGRVRQDLLNAAIARGDAHSVREFFARFLRADGATQLFPAQSNQQRAGSFLSRQVYDRAMIGRLYEQRRRGKFSDADWAKIEADIFRAQHEGRFRDVDYVSK